MATIWAKRRPIRDEAERKNEFTCRISPIPHAPAETSFREQRRMKVNGVARAGCRGRGQNSNAAIVEAAIHSGFIVAIQAATVEIFSLENPEPPMANRYPGANPNVRSKRRT
jgi:hypothetical protein